jgi:hypothetical protein
MALSHMLALCLFVYAGPFVMGATIEPYVLRVKYDVKDYLLHYKTFATCSQATEVCKGNGGVLVNIAGKEVQRQIFETMKGLIGEHFFDYRGVEFNETWSYWISQFSNRPNQNTGMASPYSNWYVDVSGPVWIYNNRPCVEALLGTDEGYWKTAPQPKKQPFVCEIARDIGVVDRGNSTYKVYGELKARNDADALCRFNGGHLPYIKNIDDNKFVTSFADSYVSGYATHSYTNGYGVWLGVTNASSDHSIWAFDDGSNATFTNWQEGQPNTWYSQYGNASVFASVNGENKWSIAHPFGGTVNMVVCEFEKPLVVDVVNTTHIVEWLNSTQWYSNGTITITLGNVSNTTYVHNSTTFININNNNVTNMNVTNVNVTNINNTNVENIIFNNTIYHHNSTTNINNTNIVYDRKMNIGTITQAHVLWTVVGIGGFIVLIGCVMVGFCVSFWCWSR